MMTSNVKNDVKEELQRYLKEKEINALFVSIVEALLIEKPEEPIRFIFKFLLVRVIIHVAGVIKLLLSDMCSSLQDKFPSQLGALLEHNVSDQV
jgi:hypothetical protein